MNPLNNFQWWRALTGGTWHKTSVQIEMYRYELWHRGTFVPNDKVLLFNSYREEKY